MSVRDLAMVDTIDSTRREAGLLALGIVAVVLLLLYGCAKTEYYTTQSSSCPVGRYDTTEVPRPALRRLLLTPGEDLEFQIDIHALDEMRPLDWKKMDLLSGDYVLLDAIIDAEGRVRTEIIQDIGAARTGELIADAVRTWRYTPYKSGTLRLEVIVTNSLISVDTTRLVSAASLGECDVRTDQVLHLQNHGSLRIELR